MGGFVARGPLYMGVSGNINLGSDWRTADRSSVDIAPNPTLVREAIVQVYAARAFNWRGATWLATKAQDAESLRVHEVLSWLLNSQQPVVVSREAKPDRSWYGNTPEILVDIRGDLSKALIPSIDSAVKSYPYPTNYTIWPEPNSNTFTAWLAREVPELELNLPTTAIGKDYLPQEALFATAPIGSGYQFSLAGMFGVIFARHEGLEVNVLGLNLGIDPLEFAIKLPGVGGIGRHHESPIR